MGKISVVVPCHNAAEYLDKCVEYLLYQTIGIENMEIILVDDASTDDGATQSLIMEYERQFPETVMAVFLEENLRQGGARNVGVSYAGGEYLIFCDADDWMLEETLEHCYHAAKKYDADVVEFKRINVGIRDMHIDLKRGDDSHLTELDTEEKRKAYLLDLKTGDYGSQNKLYRLSMIRDNQIVFPEHFIFEEVSFALPVRMYARRHYFLDEQLYVYYVSPGSTIRGDWGREHRWDNLRIWILLTGELEQRGLFSAYRQEIEYLFLRLGVGYMLAMLFVNYVLTKDEWKFLVETIQRLFPDIRENKYLQDNSSMENRVWNQMLLGWLNMEFTDESVQAANRLMAECTRS